MLLKAISKTMFLFEEATKNEKNGTLNGKITLKLRFSLFSFPAPIAHGISCLLFLPLVIILEYDVMFWKSEYFWPRTSLSFVIITPKVRKKQGIS